MLNIKAFSKITPLYFFYLRFSLAKFRLTKLIIKKNINYSNLNHNEFPIVIDNLVQPFCKWNEKTIHTKNAVYVSRNTNPAEKIIRKKNQLLFNYFNISSEIKINFFDYFGSNLKFLKKLFKSNLFHFLDEYNLEKIIWKKTSKKFNSKIFVTFNKWDAKYIPAFSAINDLQGISIVYQTSYYEIPDGCSNIKADILFSFSNLTNKQEIKTGSQITYYISCGYIRDYLFKDVEEKSKNIKNKLKNNGCKKIIALFDQSYGWAGTRDKRWFYSQDYYQDIYIFWLEKLINEPWLGLIFKQKKPGLMFLEPNNTKIIAKGFEKLQPLLNKALSTGRCYFYIDWDDFSAKNFNESVAEAAMAADISISTSLFAGTAGIESALTGTPTLYYDDLNFIDSQFYKLGKNKVVFDNWDIMWEKIQGYFNDQYVIGDWSKILNDIDPFRDGKASYRINQFLVWLQEGYKINNNKDDVIRYAVKKYSDLWGADKIINN